MPPNHKTATEVDAEAEEEEDYMSMIIEEPQHQQRETLTQRKLRKQRESEAKARIPSKAERAAAEVTRRDNALSASVLDPSSKGFQMMAKLGFKAGDSLGKKSPLSTPPAPAPAEEGPTSTPPLSREHQKGSSEEAGNGEIAGNDGERQREHMTTTATSSSTTEKNPSPAQNLHDWIQSRAEPIRLIVKEDRGGIGLDSEKKRKFREDTDHIMSTEKKVKADENEYRDRMRAEREERRLEAQVGGAQKVLEKLENEDEENNAKTDATKKKRPISEINVLYRGLVRERLEKEREKMVRMIFDNSLTSSSLSPSISMFPKPKLPNFNSEDDGDEAGRDIHALQDKEENISFVEQSLDDEDVEDDKELNEFNALPASERLEKLVVYMREKYWYCFWCKYRYDSAEMEGCPGVTEEDHD